MRNRHSGRGRCSHKSSEAKGPSGRCPTGRLCRRNEAAQPTESPTGLGSSQIPPLLAPRWRMNVAAISCRNTSERSEVNADCHIQWTQGQGHSLLPEQVRRKEKAGDFPLHIPLSDRRIAWIEAEIDSWISSAPQCAIRSRPRKANPGRWRVPGGASVRINRQRRRHCRF